MIHLLLALFLLQTPADPTASVAAEPDAQKRAAAVTTLLKRFEKSMTPVLVKLADADVAPVVRKTIVDRLGQMDGPGIVEMLERHAASDPDPEVALLALERLRVQQARRLGQLFDQRLVLARARHDTAGVETLAAEHQRWMSFARGATLPAFLQTPPPVFEAFPASKPVRVLVFSDFGTGSPEQRKTAAAIRTWHKRHPFDLGITVGDNFPSVGMTSPEDPRWKRDWQDLYEPLGIPIFAVTGNHDWGLADSPAAEILRTQHAGNWRMPALYYSFTAGPIQFFGLCGEALSETQLRWLDRELGRSRARWKIVYGHEPIYSYGAHGPTPQFERQLLPLLRHRANVYLAGHEHTAQHLKPEDGVHFLITPSAGQGPRARTAGARTLYTGSYYGFLSFEGRADALAVSFIDADGKLRYQTKLQ
jgi:tartrate-resistant acid phosphatase type 5